MNLRELPEENDVTFEGKVSSPKEKKPYIPGDKKDVTFEGKVSSPKEKKPYIPGDEKEIQLHLVSNDERAKDAKFKIISCELADGSKVALDYSSLRIGENLLRYTPAHPGTHALTIKVAVEGEEDSAQTFQCTIEAAEANRKVRRISWWDMEYQKHTLEPRDQQRDFEGAHKPTIRHAKVSTCE